MRQNRVLWSALWIALVAFLGVPAAAMGLGPVVMVVGDTTDTTILDGALKIIFDDALVNNVVTDSELLDQFENGGGIQTDQTTGGRYIETAQLFDLPAGVGARSEGDYIPIPSGPTIQNSRITLKKVMGAVELTAEALKRVRTDEGAFVNWAERQLPLLVERVTHELDRMLLGYGAGIKARVDMAAPAVDLTIDSAYGVAGLSDGLLQFLAKEKLRAGPNADGTGLRGTTYEVERVDHAAGTLVLDAVTDLVDNDYLFSGDSAGNSAGKEPMGFLGMTDDGGILATFQNIPRASFPAWQAHVIDAQADPPFGAGQKLTENVILYADDITFTRGGGKPDLLVTSRQGLRQLWADLKLDRSLNDPTQFTGGNRGVSVWVGDRVFQIKVARKMPRELAFGISRRTVKKFMLHNWQWDDTTGSIWRQVTDGTGRKDAFYAYGSLFLEMGCSDPQKSFRIENITDAAF